MTRGPTVTRTIVTSGPMASILVARGPTMTRTLVTSGPMASILVARGPTMTRTLVTRGPMASILVARGPTMTRTLVTSGPMASILVTRGPTVTRALLTSRSTVTRTRLQVGVCQRHPVLHTTRTSLTGGGSRLESGKSHSLAIRSGLPRQRLQHDHQSIVMAAPIPANLFYSHDGYKLCKLPWTLNAGGDRLRHLIFSLSTSESLSIPHPHPNK